MTVKELLAFFEGYYGEKYTGLFLDIMTDYLENSKEEYLSAMAKVMVLRFSRIYNKVPCPADIEKNEEEISTVFSKDMQEKQLKSLSEPQEKRATTEEAEMYIGQMKSIVMGRSNNAMEKPLNDYIGSMPTITA